MNSYTLNLSGQWNLVVKDRVHKTKVPGLATDPKVINDSTIRYEKYITLPEGKWSNVTLLLKGARFCPKISINEDLVASSNGGMAPISLTLRHKDLLPGNQIGLAIELLPLDEMDEGDASRIPEADYWRSNVSSCLWDDVILQCHGETFIERCIPNYCSDKDRLSVSYELKGACKTDQLLRVQVINGDTTIMEKQAQIQNNKMTLTLPLDGQCSLWSPENPTCYTLRTCVMEGQDILHDKTLTLGLKEFSAKNKDFYLNGKPVKLRAASVVWHRLLRDEEAKELAFDGEWFRENVVIKLKELGANTLRFHLGMPPEYLLDLCDEYGLLVQAEWSFFHGLKGSKDSLLQQWRQWIDLCVAHPSTAIIHAWNETNEKELKVAYEVLDDLLQEYPPLVIGHKDVIHIHKYWWSLFENIGLYYDSADEFPLPIMVDEFGGNYLDGKGDPGDYPMVKGAFKRFLGNDHTLEKRLELNSLSNVKIAEYWRRIDAAGYSPFCLLGSPEDGSHHYMGPLEKGLFKPVMNDLAVVFSPISCSMDLWNKNFLPGETISFPLHLFNEEHSSTRIELVCQVKDQDQNNLTEDKYVFELEPTSHIVKDIELTLPQLEGQWTICCQIINPPAYLKVPLRSTWAVYTLEPKASIKNPIAVYPWDEELKAFLNNKHIPICNPEDNLKAPLITGAETWKKLEVDSILESTFKERLYYGGSIVMLDVGPRELYLPGHESALASLYKPEAYKKTERSLFDDILLTFSQVPEPESCFHPTEEGQHLWKHLHEENTRLWNGLRGGLVLPTWDMEVRVPSHQGFINYWSEKGAETNGIMAKNYYAFELAGFYTFTYDEDDILAQKALRDKVRFLVEDAPALKVSIDTEAPLTKLNLAHMYQAIPSHSSIETQCPLVSSGKDLVRTPVVSISYKEHGNKLVLSQLLTEGRLHNKMGSFQPYELYEDPAAGQFILNLIQEMITE